MINPIVKSILFVVIAVGAVWALPDVCVSQQLQADSAEENGENPSGPDSIGPVLIAISGLQEHIAFQDTVLKNVQMDVAGLASRSSESGELSGSSIYFVAVLSLLLLLGVLGFMVFSYFKFRSVSEMFESMDKDLYTLLTRTAPSEHNATGETSPGSARKGSESDDVARYIPGMADDIADIKMLLERVEPISGRRQEEASGDVAMNESSQTGVVSDDESAENASSESDSSSDYPDGLLTAPVELGRIEELIDLYHKTQSQFSQWSEFQSRLKAKRVGVKNSMERKEKPGVDAVYREAGSGSFLAVRTTQQGRESYAVLPWFSVAFDADSFGPGGIAEVFDCGDANLNMRYRNAQVIRQALFVLKKGQVWELEKKGELKLGEPSDDG